MALKLGELVAYLKGDNTNLKRTLAESKTEVSAAGEAMDRSSAKSTAQTALNWARSFQFLTASSRTAHRNLNNDIDATQARIRRLSEEFGRTRNQSLLGDIQLERSKLQSLEQAATALGTGGLRTLLGGFSAVSGGIVSVATNLWNLIPVLLITAAALSAVVPVSLLFGGVLGSIPALATGAIAALGALGLGAIGLADAWQDTAAAGGSVADRARQIAIAERHLADANREATDAQEDLNRARLTASERMQDLNRNLAGARLDEESAINAVADAERDLERARLTEHPERIRRAELAYRRAGQSLDDVRDRVEDLTEEQTDAAAKGVEGSDEVRSALERQRHAVEGISDAQYELGRAQAETSGGAVKQTTAIAASAAAAIAMLKSLGGRYTSLRLEVQERLFAGVDQEILGLSDAWLPTLRVRLGGMADMFNGLFKQWAETSKKPEFISNIAAAWQSVETMFGRIGSAIVGPGLEAFGRLARAAGPFIEGLGDGIAKIVERFAEWIKLADESGELDQFFADATQFLRDVGAIGADALSIVGSIISILTKGTDSARESSIEALKRNMDDLAKWFDDPENQKKIEDFFHKLEDFYFWIKDEAIPTVKSWIDKIDEWSDRIGGWIQRARDFRDGVKDAFNEVKDAINGFGTGVASFNPFQRFKDGFRDTFNWIIDRWNRLSFDLGPVHLSPWQIPRLAQGAYIPPTPGGSLAIMAEAGKAEWALPDDKLQAALDQAVARGKAGSDGASTGPMQEVHVHNYIDGRELKSVVRVEIKASNRDLKRRVQAGTGTR